jgi:Rrf2 family iron-sulfur cluster assembly transcriptional regulator
MHQLLPQTAEYALRAMTCIASKAKNSPVRSKDLVEHTHIPEAYLAKVLRKLVEAGLLTSQKGHGGGFELARDAVEIRFVDILRAVEVDPALRHCAFGFPKCDASRPCPLHDHYEQLQRHYLAWAARATLADVDCTTLKARVDAESTEGSG